MNKVLIYHNPRCSKSREALQLLNSENCEVTIKEYLKTPPTQKELRALLKLLGMKASQLVRTKEPLYIEHFKNKKISETEWIKILTENPVLIERPIVITDSEAIIGRPPELVIDLIRS